MSPTDTLGDALANKVARARFAKIEAQYSNGAIPRRPTPNGPRCTNLVSDEYRWDFPVVGQGECGAPARFEQRDYGTWELRCRGCADASSHRQTRDLPGSWVIVAGRSTYRPDPLTDDERWRMLRGAANGKVAPPEDGNTEAYWSDPFLRQPLRMWRPGIGWTTQSLIPIGSSPIRSTGSGPSRQMTSPHGLPTRSSLSPTSKLRTRRHLPR